MPSICSTVPVLFLALPVLAQTPAVLRDVPGTAAGDQTGEAVCGVGDMDGDGLPDFAVAEPYHDAGGLIDRGRVRVFSGRTGAVIWSFLGAGAGDRFGWSVAGPGDVDGDGRPDLVVGSPYMDLNGVDSGAVLVWSGRTGALIRSHAGDQPGDLMGMGVGAMGDLDRDGCADYGGGAPFADAPGVDQGRARIWSGRTGALWFARSGAFTGDHYGHALEGLGDVDGDGWPDFQVTAPWSDQVASKCGSSMVYSGRTQTILYTFTGTGLGHEFGTSICSPGDVDGDGRADIAVGAPEDKTFGDDSGSVRVHSGMTGAVIHVWYGDSAYDYFGHSIAAGDVDGDGVRDLLIGAPLDERPGVPANAGIVRAWSGRTGLLLWSVAGNQGAEWLGRAMGFVGDLNGDGFGEVLAGAPFRDAPAVDSGSARVFCGLAGLPSITTFGSGCPGYRPLQISYAGAARLGQTLRILVGNGPAGTAVGWVVHSFFAGPPYPVDLGTMGLLGCHQYVSLDLPVPVVLQGGAASLDLVIPASLAPCGLRLYHQAVVLDPPAPGGFAVSRGARAIIGQ